MTAEEIDLIAAYRKLDPANQAFLRGVILGLGRLGLGRLGRAMPGLRPSEPPLDDDED